ncbi:hypothetical protein [Streptomyces sp. NPDC057403]|uniref:hypothetical protein n=1 Tax=Streptomyces sp. NPDC057403 TaxID=3346119 RepID=UPI0036B8B1B3
MSWLEEVRRIMRSHPGAGDTVDWVTIEASWGTRFPSDYKEFMAEYGEGAIDDYLALMAPETHLGPGVESCYMSMQQESEKILHRPAVLRPRLRSAVPPGWCGR